MQADPEQVPQIEIVEIVEIVEIAHDLKFCDAVWRTTYVCISALIKGTHGLGFALKLGRMGIVLSDACILLIAVCGNTSAIVIACAETYHSPEPLPSFLQPRAFAFSTLRTTRLRAVSRGSSTSYRCIHLPGVPHTASHQGTCRYCGTKGHCSLSSGSGRHRCRRRALNPEPKPEPESESKLKP